jgi:hypothetical protein
VVQATVGIRAAPGRRGGRGPIRCRARFLPTPLPGGIGFYIRLYIGAFQYDKVATLTVVVLDPATLAVTCQSGKWSRKRTYARPKRGWPRN